MKDILDRLEQRRGQARLGGGEARIEAGGAQAILARAIRRARCFLSRVPQAGCLRRIM